MKHKIKGKEWERIFDFLLTADAEIIEKINTKKVAFEVLLVKYKEAHLEKYGKKFEI
jgi:hypothetical protein